MNLSTNFKFAVVLAVVTIAGVSTYYLTRNTSVANERKRVFVISQKGEQFTPNNLDVKRGDVIEIFNDDGDLLHHAYIQSKNLNYDSGDQTPGSRHDVTMSQVGTFTVLCGIHPRMKLTVKVEETPKN